MSFKTVLDRGKHFVDNYQSDSWLWHFGRRLVIGTTGTVSKAFLYSAFRPRLHNARTLFEALRISQLENRGLITVLNHSSMLDDPLVWGLLPLSQLWNPNQMRWTLGADNLCFFNRFVSNFFSMGQVLSTKRWGGGPFQGSIDAAIYLLSNENKKQSHWVHLFPESFVHQAYPPYQYTLRYFHWGVSRLILESAKPPLVVPIYTKGLDMAWPEDKPKVKRRWWQRFGHDVDVVVGEPIDIKLIETYRNKWTSLVMEKLPEGQNLENSDLNNELKVGDEAESLRSEVAQLVRVSVLNTQSMINVKTNERPEFADANFWKIPQDKRIIKTMGSQTPKEY